MISPLAAIPKTPLYERLSKEGRVLSDYDTENTRGTNIVPKNMTRDQLLDGHTELYKRLFTHDNIAKRVDTKGKYLRNPVVSAEPISFTEVSRMRDAMPSWARPRNRVEAKDWCLALGMRDYVERNFGCNGS